MSQEPHSTALGMEGRTLLLERDFCRGGGVRPAQRLLSAQGLGFSSYVEWEGALCKEAVALETKAMQLGNRVLSPWF